MRIEFVCAAALLGGCTLIFGDPLTAASGDLGVAADLAGLPPGDLAGADGALACTRPLDAPDDDRHCGPCDVDCTTLPGTFGRAYCLAGECTFDCRYSANGEHCSSDPRTGCDTNLASATSCGACDVRCPADKPLCSDGDCAGACPAGQMICGTTCAEPTSDPFHCGACGTVCNTTTTMARHELHVCQGGSCQLSSCEGGWIRSGSACVSHFDVIYASHRQIYWVTGSGSDLYLLEQQASDARLLRRSGTGSFAVEETGLRGMHNVFDSGSEILVGATGGIGRRQSNGTWMLEASPLSGGDVWSFGVAGGVTWAVMRSALMGTTSTMHLFRRTGPGAWTEELLPNGDVPNHVAGTASGEVWVVAGDGASSASRLHRKPSGGAFVVEALPLSSTHSFTAVWTHGNDVFLPYSDGTTLNAPAFVLSKVGGGATWQSESAPGFLYGLAFTSGGDVFAAASQRLWHRTSAGWVEEGSGIGTVVGAFVSASGEVLAFGFGGVSRRR